MKLGSTVWRDDATRGTLVRGPRRASRGMLWVQWTDRPAPQLWDRVSLMINDRKIYQANLAPDPSRR